MPLLATDSLRLGHGRLEVVREASIEVDGGELVSLLGANGAGKSTLVQALVGWIKPIDGKIFLRGRDITNKAPWQRNRLGLGLVPERGRLFGGLTVEQNLDIVRPAHEALDFVYDLFPILKERGQQPAATLSGGQRQMLSLGRALAQEPQMLLVDEMSTGLMPVLVKELFSVLRRLADGGLGVLLVEQNTDVLSIADRAYVMQAGSIVLEGDAASLEQNPEIRRAYLGLG